MSPEPTEKNPDDGPECPECGNITEVWRHDLTDEEHTYVISCPSCGFEIETESNLAAADRKARMHEEIESFDRS